MFPPLRPGQIERAGAALLIRLETSWSHGDTLWPLTAQDKISWGAKMSGFLQLLQSKRWTEDESISMLTQLI